MQCDRARILIQEQLDGSDSPELSAHVTSCSACADEQARMLALDSLLRAEPLVTPPRHFGSRVMNRLEVEEHQRRSWNRSLMQIGVVLSGTLGLALLSALLVHGWQFTMSGTAVTDLAMVGARGASILADVVWRPFVRDALRVPVYVALTMALAVAWFGALVVPRLARRAAVRAETTT